MICQLVSRLARRCSARLLRARPSANIVQHPSGLCQRINDKSCETPIIGDCFGRAVRTLCGPACCCSDFSTASVGVPPAESFLRNWPAFLGESASAPLMFRHQEFKPIEHLILRGHRAIFAIDKMAAENAVNAWPWPARVMRCFRGGMSGRHLASWWNPLLSGWLSWRRLSHICAGALGCGAASKKPDDGIAKNSGREQALMFRRLPRRYNACARPTLARFRLSPIAPLITEGWLLWWGG